MIETFHRFLLGACVVGLSVVVCAAVFSVAAYAWRKFRSKMPWGRLVAISAMAGVCCWAAQKRVAISTMNADPNMPAIMANRSYIGIDTNDWSQVVSIDFDRFIAVPQNATYYIDYRVKGSTNDADWINLLAFQLDAERPMPYEIPFPGNFVATNHVFVMYTDWTPGPTVVTNGVWHTYWALTRDKAHILPLRTEMREIAPTKLPAGYVECEYLQAFGEHTIDTGIIFLQSHSYTMKTIVSFTLTGTQRMTGNLSNYFIWGCSTDNRCKLNNTTFGTEIDEDEPFEVTHTLVPNGAKINITMDTKYGSATQNVNQSSVNYHLFSIGGASWPMSGVRIYGMVCHDNGEIIADYVPALDPNGKTCFFDLVTKKPIYNSRSTREFLYKIKE